MPVIAPLLMTYVLVCGTGQRLTDQRMAGRPGNAEYLERTSGFLPYPRAAGSPTGTGTADFACSGAAGCRKPSRLPAATLSLITERAGPRDRVGQMSSASRA